MSKQLNEPITESGIRNTNYFNGRLLTAKDLQTDQAAERTQRWQLGRGLGDGVIEGFEVTLVSAGTPATLPVVGVTKGLALNRKGQILSLPVNDEVTLVRRVDLPPPEAGIFGECGLLTSSFSNLDKGAYLLVVGPASGFQEKAPMRNVEPNGAPPGCGSKYAVEGVQFDLIKIDIVGMTALSATTRTQIQTLMTQSDMASLSKLRNILAHVCFGTEELQNIASDPFKQTNGQSAFASYGAADFMRNTGGAVTDCQVPLALVYWAGGSARFLDMWAARRRVTPGLTAQRWPPLLDERRAAEGEAVIRQFQDHAESLIREAFVDLFSATNYFRYLPPAGILALRRGTQKGFTLDTFFSGIAHRVPEFIDSSLLRALLSEAVSYQPIDLANHELVWVYRVRPNQIGAAGVIPEPTYAVFASPHLPYKATARFDVARWDVSNYARGESC